MSFSEDDLPVAWSTIKMYLSGRLAVILLSLSLKVWLDDCHYQTGLTFGTYDFYERKVLDYNINDESEVR